MRHRINSRGRPLLFSLLAALSQHISPEPRSIDHAARPTKRQPIDGLLRTLNRIMTHDILRRFHELIAFGLIDSQFFHAGHPSGDHMNTDKQPCQAA